uniref:MoaB/Mog domain-containing protein n=1 Tax=Oryza punctata TaxID=4537 RepID=A0A0E0JGL1_ORYPU
MEIDRAVRGSSDSRLRTKYDNAVYVVQRAFALYPNILNLILRNFIFQVLLHLLRAGYYLHKSSSDGEVEMNTIQNCPVRTIYFESPCAFPEINSFTYETVSTYTSIGSIYDTVPNALLSDSTTGKSFRPAYMLSDGRLERAGRTKKNISSVSSNGTNSTEVEQTISRSASIIVVGDEILFGTVEDKLGAGLCKKLHAIGWRVSHVAVVSNEIDSVAEEVERCKSTDDMVFLVGGLGPLHSDISLAGVAKAFGVRLAPDEEFEEYLSQLIGDNYTGDRNEMALLPEGITELLHHKMLPLPLIKCKNVVILAATNVDELETEWGCLLDTQESGLVMAKSFVSKHLSTSLLDVKIAPVVAKLCIDFSDVYIGCSRISRSGPLVVSFIGKDNQRVEAAAEKLMNNFEGQFSQVDSCK